VKGDLMSSLVNTYRNTLLRKRDQLVKLKQDLAQEQTKIGPLQKKIISAHSMIGRTKNQATIKSKYREIERSNKSIADIQKKCENIYKKIAQKEKDLAVAEKRYRNEEAKVNRRNAEIEEKRHQELARVQDQMQTEIQTLKAIPKKIKVLFMASNPLDTPQLRLNEEVRSIQQKIPAF